MTTNRDKPPQNSTEADIEATAADPVLVAELEEELTARYGPALGGEDLRKALAYPSMSAFLQAMTRGTVPVPVFSIGNRRGWFALTKDVVRWLAERRATARTKRHSDTTLKRRGP